MLIGIAPAAHTGKGQVAGIDPSACFGSRLAAQGLRHLHLGQIRHAVALGTDEVDMWLDISVEPLHPVHCSDADDQPLLLKKRQVSVHRSERDIRVIRLQPGKDPVCRRVDIGGSQASQNSVPLAKMLCSLLHRHLLYENDYHLRPYHSTSIFICQ